MLNLPPGCSLNDVESAFVDYDDFTEPLYDCITLACATITSAAVKFLEENGATIEAASSIYLVTLPSHAVVHSNGNADFSIVFHPEIEETLPLDFALYTFFPDVARTVIEFCTAS